MTEEQIARFGNYFHHFTCLDDAQWDSYTYERFAIACASVRNAWLRSNAEGKAAELEHSIRYESGRGIIYSARAHVYRVPECICWDSMHSIFASGGLAQIQCNDFILAVEREGISPTALQDFCNRVKLPSGRYLTIDLKERLRRKEPSHLRAFAADMLDIIPCLVAFCNSHTLPGLGPCSLVIPPSACFATCPIKSQGYKRLSGSDH